MNRAPSAAGGRGLPERLALPLALALLVALQWSTRVASEPFFYNDETRHVMTGVFFRDLLHALPVAHPRAWAEGYYSRYPALGLLIWPPLFHFLEGLAMCVLGIGVGAGRLLVLGFCLLAAACVYRLLLPRHGPGIAALGALLFGLLPQVFSFSGYVMLEVPALALGLAGTVCWSRYLEAGRARDVFLAAALAAAAALTRYDALLFPASWIVWTLLAGSSRRLLRPAPILAGAVALAALTPFYWVAAREIGWLHASTVERPNMGGAFAAGPARLGFYFAKLPTQIGWPAIAAVVAGLAGTLRPGAPRRNVMSLTLFACVWAVFTSIGELEGRHDIYWTPALALLAVEGAALAPRRWRATLLAALVLATGAAAVSPERSYVRGYAEAARRVLADPGGNRVVFYDGGLEGDFVYQVRRLDPSMRERVVRGDRLLYSTVEVPELEYREYARSDSAVVRALDTCGADWIVVEDLPGKRGFPAAERLRRVLGADPSRFAPAGRIEIASNRHDLAGLHVLLYRNLTPGRAPLLPQAPFVPQLRRRIGAGA